MSRDPDYKSSYQSFMQEYVQLGHMSPSPRPPPNVPTYYVPHHAIIKRDSSTTKTRVVFDASAKTSTGISLNQILCVGPNVQPDLFNILLNFRTWPVAYVADIEKMYRQVLLDQNDRDLLRIIWRDNPQLPLQEFTLNTVTYGTAPAAFLAIQALNQLADDEVPHNDQLKNIVQSSFYVDNLAHGNNSTHEAITQVEQITQLLLKGGFPLESGCQIP